MYFSRTLASYRVSEGAEAKILARIAERVTAETGMSIAYLEETGIGQNPSYRAYAPESPEPALFLKIIMRKGYPAFAALSDCSAILNSIGLNVCDLVYHEPGDDIVPYGFLAHPWVSGDSVPVDQDGWPNSPDWIVDFAGFLRRVREAKVSGFGYLGRGPRYESLVDYFDNMQEVIDHSFGDGFTEPDSIRNLEQGGALEPGFLDFVFSRVQSLARTITATPEPVLIHGDMLPTNLIYTPEGPLAVDWDECRTGWWVYEIARTLYYFDESPGHLERFLSAYGADPISRHDIDVGIRLEHVRQHLRTMCIAAFASDDQALVGRQIAGLAQQVIRLVK